LLALRRFLLLPLSVFPLIAFFFSTFLLPTALFGAAFLFANFLGVLLFCARRFAGDFLPSLFFDLVDFFLVFFLVAIRAV
jgi:hypothetical protein